MVFIARVHLYLLPEAEGSRVTRGTSTIKIMELD